MRYHRLHQFSRLPPVPERPSLENRELSPVPDIVSPTSPILSPTLPPAQAPPLASSRRSSLPSPHRPGSGSREASPRKREVEVDQEENLVERRAGLGEGGPSATLGRRRSRIPQPRHQGGGRLGRSASESDLGTDSVDERLETLLQLLGGARTSSGSSNSSGAGGAAPDIVAGTGSPSDTLQYLSQLESVARKLKDQLIRQNQGDARPESRGRVGYRDESEC